MEIRMISEVVAEAFMEIQSQGVIRNENLFGLVNNLEPRDVAYVLLEIEKRLGIDIEKLVMRLDACRQEYTVETLIEAIAEQKR